MKILLETTVQLHRVTDDPGTKARINETLRGKHVYTSSYVLREFLRTVIKDIAYVHKAVQAIDKDADGRVALGNLDRYLASGRGNFSVRAGRRERYVTAAILDKYSNTRIPRLQLLRFLEETAQQWIEDFYEVLCDKDYEWRIDGEYFLTNLDDPTDEMQCWICNNGPIPGPPPFPSGAAKFLQRKRSEAKIAENSVRAAIVKEKDCNLLKILDSLKNDRGEYDFIGKLKVNTRGNWSLGDLLIALETPSDAHIYSDDRHFNVLCKSLGKQRYPGYLPADKIKEERAQQN